MNPIPKSNATLSALQVSSYYPAVCTACGKKGLCRTAKPLRDQWAKNFTSSRNDILKKLLSGEPLSTPPSEMDYELPGFTNQMFNSNGIYSDCCKLEILTYIPYDKWLFAFEEADSSLPPDFDHGDISWSRLEDCALPDNEVNGAVKSSSLKMDPIVVGTRGTDREYRH